MTFLPEKVSLTDVAARAGVSIATASRVLNGTAMAAATTRAAVSQAAEDLGYVPDLRFRLMGKSRSRRPGNYRTGNIGVLLFQRSAAIFATNSYYSRLFWSIERQAGDLGWHVILSTIRSDSDQYLPAFVKDFKVDGVLVADQCPGGLLERIQRLVPVVLVNSTSPGIAAVMPDEDSGIKQALTYLRELGHRRIWYFDIHDAANFHHDIRTRAFANYTVEWVMPETRAVVLRGRDKSLAEICLGHLRQWRDSGEMPTAILCGADVYAFAFLEAAEILGLSIPGDLSVMGADDDFRGEYVRPKLSSIRQPLEEMGAAAVRMLLDRIDKGSGAKATQTFEVSLVARGSCGAAPAERRTGK